MSLRRGNSIRQNRDGMTEKKVSLSLGRENWLAKTLGGLRLQRVPVEWLFLRSSWSLLGINNLKLLAVEMYFSLLI